MKYITLILCIAGAWIAAGCGGDETPVVTPTPWPTCDSVTMEGTLADKAAEFDRIAKDWHLTGDGLLRSVYLTEDLGAVAKYEHAENTILWSGMYLASQAFRYAVTGDAGAVDNAKTVIKALRQLTEVTGSRGLYGRSMAKPGVTYNYDGVGTTSWTVSTATGYEGWSFRNDVIKDGYDGLMFGYAAALEHFDDPWIVQEVSDLLAAIADHLVGNGLKLIDTDGEVTEHGRLYENAFDDFPGFNALLAASWVKVMADAPGADSSLDDFYYGCMMNMRQADCPDIGTGSMGPYIDNMETALNLFLPNCKQNYDNFDMCYQAIYPLLRREKDPELRQRLLGVLRNNMFHTDNSSFQSMAVLGNSYFTFSYVALTGDTADDPIVRQAVENGICTLKVFPPLKYDRHIPADPQEGVCINRLGKATAAEPTPLSNYAFDNYLWRLDPFEIQPEECPEDRRQIYSPEDFLVAYWMGRYHGIIPEGL